MSLLASQGTYGAIFLHRGQGSVVAVTKRIGIKVKNHFPFFVHKLPTGSQNPNLVYAFWEANTCKYVAVLLKEDGELSICIRYFYIVQDNLCVNWQARPDPIR